MSKNQKNKNKNIKKVQKNGEAPMNAKKKNQITVAATITGVALVAVIIMAIAAPLIKINSDFDRIFKQASQFQQPTLAVTDMASENVFDQSSGEAVINDQNDAKALIARLSELAQKFRYDGKDKTPLNMWDIRVMIYEGNERMTFYIAEEKMYYMSGSVKYVFVPEDAETAESYKLLYKDIDTLVK